MPKGTGRPFNRANKQIVGGMKKARKSGLGKRTGMHPGTEGTPRGVGTFSTRPTKRQTARTKRQAQNYPISIIRQKKK